MSKVWLASYDHPDLGKGPVIASYGPVEESSPQRVYCVLSEMSRRVGPGSTLARILSEAKIVIYDYNGSGVRYELEPIKQKVPGKLRRKFPWHRMTPTPNPVWRPAPAWGS